MVDIKANLKKIRETLNDDVLLIAVTKTHGVDEINEAIDAGVTDIGENKVQEILEKYDRVKPVRWHMIGHLQTNKVKSIIDKVDLIHSLDSLKLAHEIDKRAKQIGKIADVLVQVNAADEQSKFGVATDELAGLIDEILKTCENINIKGLMFVAPFAEDPEDVRGYFAKVAELFKEYKKEKHPRLDFKYLSMGMSHDYIVAIEEGANMVRVGSAIFGSRVY